MSFVTITSDMSRASNRRFPCVLCYVVLTTVEVDLLAFTADSVLGTKPADKSGCLSI